MLTLGQLLRRTNAMSFSRDSTIQPPSIDDSADMLHSKWKQFVVLESYKRFATNGPQKQYRMLTKHLG